MSITSPSQSLSVSRPSFLRTAKNKLKGLLLLPYQAVILASRSHQKLRVQAENSMQPKSVAKAQSQLRHFTAEIKSTGRPFKMLLLRPGYIEDHIAEVGTWEPNLSSLMRFFMKTEGIFLDVGANIGFHTLSIASLFPQAQCIAFEPNRFINAQLNSNIRLNDHLTNIVTYNIAISDRSGDIDFYMQKASSYNRGLSSTSYNYDMEGQDIEKVRVKMERLDEVLEDAIQDKVSVIKIDTQGSEYQVLCGATQIIAKSKPVIFFEFEVDYHKADPEGKFKQILAQFSSCDYQVFLINAEIDQTFQAFDVAEICKIPRFEGDFIALPNRLLA
jgi:FkbM family methyltransferase